MRQPVRQQECRLFRKMSIVENEQKFSTIRTETLKRVRMASREVPKVSLLNVVDKATAFSVECSDSDFAFKDICPLGLFVPMQFPDDTFVQSHVNTSEFDGCRQLLDCGLSCPTTFFNTNVRICEAPTTSQQEQTARKLKLTISYS